MRLVGIHLYTVITSGKRNEKERNTLMQRVASGECKSQSKEVVRQTKPALQLEWQHQGLFHGHLNLVVNRNAN